MISANWRSGNARSCSSLGIRRVALQELPKTLEIMDDVVQDDLDKNEEEMPELTEGVDSIDTIIQFNKHHFFTASRNRSLDISIHRVVPSGESVPLGMIRSEGILKYWSNRKNDSSEPLRITEMRLDGEENSAVDDTVLRLVVFYSTGQFTLFRISFLTPNSLITFSSIELFTHSPFLSSTTAYDPIYLARLHGLLLVTCSESFVLRFWQCNSKNQFVQIDRSWKSHEIWSPASLTLEPVEERGKEDEDIYSRPLSKPTITKFKVTLAYSTPSLSSVGVNVFTIDFAPIIPAPASTNSSVGHHSSSIEISTQHAIAPIQFDQLRRLRTWRNDARSLVTGIEHDPPFVVLSKSDNTIDVYEVISTPSPPVTPSIRPPPPNLALSASAAHTPSSPHVPKLSIVPRRTLYGHHSAVTSLSMIDGKCVSAGSDGNLKIWDLSQSNPPSIDQHPHNNGLNVVVNEANRVRIEVEVERDAMTSMRSAFEQLKEETGGSEGFRSRLKRVFFDDDKIVVIVSADEASSSEAGVGVREGERNLNEDVRILRFD
jgi:hypothetical protein